jgi:hypothetical protein
MARVPHSPLLQCRGPERRVTPLQVVAAVLLVLGFVAGAGLLKSQSPPLAPAAAETLLP